MKKNIGIFGAALAMMAVPAVAGTQKPRGFEPMRFKLWSRRSAGLYRKNPFRGLAVPRDGGPLAPGECSHVYGWVAWGAKP